MHTPLQPLRIITEEASSRIEELLGMNFQSQAHAGVVTVVSRHSRSLIGLFGSRVGFN